MSFNYDKELHKNFAINNAGSIVRSMTLLGRVVGYRVYTANSRNPGVCYLLIQWFKYSYANYSLTTSNKWPLIIDRVQYIDYYTICNAPIDIDSCNLSGIELV